MSIETAAALHPLLAARWSPSGYDERHDATAADVDLLLEAARWAPSAGNSQPWAFLAVRRGEPAHTRLIRHLARSSAGWAAAASVLVVNLAHTHVEGTDWAYSEFSGYDLGQAVAHMTVQAQAMGLHGHQFRGFDRDGIAAEFAVPGHWQVTTMTAFGRLPPGAQPTAPRPRRDLAELRWPADVPCAAS